MQSPGGVGRVADDDEIGIVGDVLGSQLEAVGPVQDEPGDLEPCLDEGRLRFGELGVDDERVLGVQGMGDEGESLRPTAGGQQHLPGHLVHGGQGIASGAGVWVVGPVPGADDGVDEPDRGLLHTHVDGQVDESLAHVLVAVVAQVGFDGGRWRCRFLHCRAGGCWCCGSRLVPTRRGGLARLHLLGGCRPGRPVRARGVDVVSGESLPTMVRMPTRSRRGVGAGNSCISGRMVHGGGLPRTTGVLRVLPDSRREPGRNLRGPRPVQVQVGGVDTAARHAVRHDAVSSREGPRRRQWSRLGRGRRLARHGTCVGAHTAGVQPGGMLRGVLGGVITGPCRIGVPRWLGIHGDDLGAVELVTDHLVTSLRHQGVGRGGGRAVAHRETSIHGPVQGQHGRHVVPVEVSTQVQQPSALGDDRHSLGGTAANVVMQARVGRQFGGVHLGEPASQVQPTAALRQGRCRERVDVNHLEPTGFEQFRGLGVAEGEGASPGHGHHGAAGRFGGSSLPRLVGGQLQRGARGRRPIG